MTIIVIFVYIRAVVAMSNIYQT